MEDQMEDCSEKWNELQVPYEVETARTLRRPLVTRNGLHSVELSYYEFHSFKKTSESP
jgi:hypothetical protein